MPKKHSAPEGRRTPALERLEPSDALLTRAEAAEATGLSVFTLDQYRQLRKRGISRGPDFVVRDGRRIYYAHSAVEAWLSRRASR